jgi:glycosyltransferase involved in cell wall biosynthesis
VRIWIFNHYASPPDRPAGTRHYDLGRVLAAQGHEITIFASGFNHFTKREERLARGERIRIEDVDGVRFVWLRTIGYAHNDLRRLVNMVSYAVSATWAQRRMRRPDVIVGSSVHLAAVGAAWLVALLRRAAFVFEVRDLWPQTLIDMGVLRPDSLAARLLRAAETFFYRRARTVICLLPHGADYIVGRGISSTKVVYVPNGIADYRTGIATIPEQSAELIDRIRDWRADGHLIAGYVGSHGSVNGVSDLVEAARELRDRDEKAIAIVLVGDGPEKEACQELAQRYGLDNVLFWPAVPKCEVRAILRALDVMIFCVRDLAVHRYGLSCNKLFDYLASGRPVVFASGVADGPVAASGGGICVPAQSPDQIADALVTLDGLGQEGRLEIGERGRTWVYRQHGMTALAGRFLRGLTADTR